jgi:vacuolar-type H+-ATPase subunit H
MSSPKDFDALLDELKILKNAEEDAKRMIDNSNVEAEKIIRGAEEEAASIISQTETEIRKAARDLREDADAGIKSEVDSLEKEFAQEVKEIKAKASEKMDEAVSYVLDRVLKLEG